MNGLGALTRGAHLVVRPSFVRGIEMAWTRANLERTRQGRCKMVVMERA